MQDNFAIQSFERGIAAQNEGAFTWEIAPVSNGVGYKRLFAVIIGAH